MIYIRPAVSVNVQIFIHEHLELFPPNAEDRSHEIIDSCRLQDGLLRWTPSIMFSEIEADVLQTPRLLDTSSRLGKGGYDQRMYSAAYPVIEYELACICIWSSRRAQ